MKGDYRVCLETSLIEHSCISTRELLEHAAEEVGAQAVHKSCSATVTESCLSTQSTGTWGGLSGHAKGDAFACPGSGSSGSFDIYLGVAGMLGVNPTHLRGLGWKSLIKGYHLMAAWRGPFLFFLFFFS